MDRHEASEKKNEIVIATWEYLLKTGLAKASVGDLCREKKIAQSSLYYWFENKDDIWISAGKYGIAKVVEALLAFTFNSVDNIPVYFKTLLDEVEKYKYEIRIAIQVTTSPVFGDRMREKAMDFRLWYDQYAKKLIGVFGCSQTQAEVFIYSIICYVIDYVLWDDREKTQMLLDNLYERVINVVDSDK